MTYEIASSRKGHVTVVRSDGQRFYIFDTGSSRKAFRWTVENADGKRLYSSSSKKSLLNSITSL